AGPRRSQRPCLAVFNRHRATSIEHHALRQRGRLDLQIASALGRAKIRYRSARSSSVPRRRLEKTGALLGCAVEVGIFGYAGLRRGSDECRGERVGVTQIGNRLRTANTVKIVSAALLVLGFLEIRQDVVITPSAVAVLAPAIIILVLAANVEQAVDRTRSAQDLAARLKYRTPLQSRFRFGLVHPVDALILEQPAISERHVDPEVAVLRTSFEQQHRIFSVCTQTICEHASRRPCADDDVVEFQNFGEEITCRVGWRFTAHISYFAWQANSVLRSGRRLRGSSPALC